MKVLHVCDTLDPHPGLFALTLPGFLVALQKQGIVSDVVAGASHADKVQASLAADQVSIVDEDNETSAMFAIAPLVKKADVVHIHTATATIGMMAAAAARSGNTPFVLSTYGELTTTDRVQGRILNWLDTRQFHKKFKGVSRIVACSEIEKSFLQIRGIKREITVLPVAYDEAPIHNAVPDNDISPIKLLWDDQTRVIAYLGDIGGNSGLIEFFNVFYELEEELRHWRIIVAGRPIDNWLDRFQTEAKKRGKDDHIAFVVFPDLGQQQAILQRADLFVQPSLSPVPAIPALKAMRNNVPVIVSTYCDMAIVDKEKPGITIQPEKEDFQSSLKKLITGDRNKLKPMGKTAKKIAREFYSWDNSIMEYLRLYKETI